MIHDGFVYLGTLMLLAAILVNLPVYLKGKGAQKFFKFAPPIVLLYLGMMLLCTMKMWNLEEKLKFRVFFMIKKQEKL